MAVSCTREWAGRSKGWLLVPIVSGLMSCSYQSDPTRNGQLANQRMPHWPSCYPPLVGAAPPIRDVRLAGPVDSLPGLLLEVKVRSKGGASSCLKCSLPHGRQAGTSSLSFPPFTNPSAAQVKGRWGALRHLFYPG